MAYDFETRHNILASRMRTLNSRTISIKRGVTTLFTDILATCYEKSAEELLALGASLNIRRRDYIITLTDIAGYEPTQGDVIVDGNLECTLVPLGDSPIYEPTSHTSVSYRIRTEVTSES